MIFSKIQCVLSFLLGLKIQSSGKWIQLKVALNECLHKHTNEDYLTCSNSLTSDLEDVVVYHGVNPNDAIRLSWKWSD